MPSLKELLAQKAALDKQIMDAQRQEKGDAIAQVKSLMAQYGLSYADLGNARAPATQRRASGSAKGSKVPAKYRNSETGESWSGRGLQPKWLKAALGQGRALSDFAV